MGQRETDRPEEKTLTYKPATWSLVLAIVSSLIIICLFVALAIAATPPTWFGFSVLCSLILFCIIYPLSLLFGIPSIFKIRKSKGQLRGMGLAIGGIVINAATATTIIGVALLIVRPAVHQTICAMNISGIAAALRVYTADHSGRYPPPDKWCDLLVQLDYITELSLRCPADKKERGSYAINPNAGPNSPPDLVLLFETRGGWNRFGGPELLMPEKHRVKGCYICFNDGQRDFVKPEELGKLKWKVEDANSVREGFSK